MDFIAEQLDAEHRPADILLIDDVLHGDGQQPRSDFRRSTWQEPVDLDGGGGRALRISWAADATCIAGSRSSGRAYFFNGATWSSGTKLGTGPTPALADVSCVSVSFCMALGVDGFAYRFSQGVWSAWTAMDPDVAKAGTTLETLSCVSTTYCVATDQLNNQISFNGFTWAAPVHNSFGYQISSTSCGTNDFCAAVDRSSESTIGRR